MPGPRLRRFDLTVFKDKSSTDSTPVAFAGAPIEFYRQGATVRTGVTVPTGTVGADVEVFDIGKLKAGDAVMAAGLGTPLVVGSVLSPTMVRLLTPSALSVVLQVGARLLVTSERPQVYSDPFGTIPLGTGIVADANGRASGYLDEDWYDYCVFKGPVLFDASTSFVKTGTGSTMSWYHTAGGDDRVVVVCVSWQEETGTEQLTEVTYGGAPMMLLGRGNYLASFYLVAPPTTSAQVVVTWSGSAHKGAVASAVSFKGAASFGRVFASAGSSNAPSLAVASDIGSLGLFLDVVAVNAAASVPTLTAGAGQSQKWNTQGGEAGHADLTLGAGSIKSTGATPKTMNWTLGASRMWGLFAAEVMPVLHRIVIDAYGAGLVQSARGLNARDFQSLEEALAALPSSGGELYVPWGDYLVATGLLIDKPNTILRGDGLGTNIRAKTANPNLDLVRIRASHVRIENLRIGYQVKEGTEAPTRNALVVEPGFSVEDVRLENVQLEGGAVAGLNLPGDVRGFLALGCVFLYNFASQGQGGDGILITPNATGLCTAEFFHCSSGYNGGIGIRYGGGASGVPQAKGRLRFVASSFEGNRGGLGVEQGNAISIESPGLRVVEILGCYFENPAPVGDSNYPVQGNQFVYLNKCDGAVVEGCQFANMAELKRLDYFVYFKESVRVRYANNYTGWSNHQTAHLKFYASDGIEFGNVGGLIGVNTVEAHGFLSLSQAVVGLPRSLNVLRPAASDVEEGSMVWVADPDTGMGHFQVVVKGSGGTKTWKNVTLV